MSFPRYERYKDSGVEWLGEIPEHWETKKLKHLAIIRNGSTPKISIPNYWDGNIVWITPSDLGRLKTKLIYDSERKITKSGLESCGTEISPKNSIIISSRAPIGHLCVTAVRSCINQGCKSIIFRQNKANSSYFYYFLMAARKNIESLGKGSTFQELGGNELANYIVIAPPIAEQERIAEFLDRKCGEIDEAIAKKQRLIELLDEQKTILINQAVTKGLNPDAPMKDSAIDWLGQIPAHWKAKRAKYLFSQSRLQPKKNDGIVTCYRDGEVTLRSNRRIDGYTVAILEQGYQGIRKGQLVINSMDAFAGSIGVSDSDGKCSPEYVVCNPINRKEVIPDYYSLLLREMALSGFVEVVCPAVRQRGKRMRYSNFSPLTIPVPPLQEQLEIIKRVSQIQDKAKGFLETTSLEIERLTELKQILIAEAVTGKIKV
jgi:type I restriction enzyme S subunit